MLTDDHIYGGESVTDPCPRCSGSFGDGDRCNACGRHRHRRHLSRSQARRRNIGGKRGRNSGKVAQHGKKG
jgi:methionyl-tRNA synthetase